MVLLRCRTFGPCGTTDAELEPSDNISTQIVVLHGIASPADLLRWANLPEVGGGPISPLRISANLRKLAVRNSENC